MRWQEEVTLTGYEMQWTVRYFLYMSRKWIPSAAGSCTASGSGLQPTGLTEGAIAYWLRKRVVWEEIMQNADRIFRGCNPAYDSPL